jgi:SAM-dependent methyltransferase
MIPQQGQRSGNTQFNMLWKMWLPFAISLLSDKDWVCTRAQMSNDLNPPEIFDRRRRHALRARAAGRSGDDFLWHHIAQDMAERLSAVTRTFEQALIIGPIGRWHAEILPPNVPCTLAPLRDVAAEGDAPIALEEDLLPFTPGSFDLVISAGTLDSVNDLPGALIQIRRLLRPDGLFLGHMFGAGTLAALKAMLLEADADRVAPHIHPQIDLRSAADLIVRAGFTLPVADQDICAVRYGSWRSIVSDIREAGLGNALAGPRNYLGKDMPARLDDAFAARADAQGKVTEGFAHIYLSGWSPSENQPRPAKRGSGQVSLADILSKDKPG